MKLVKFLSIGCVFFLAFGLGSCANAEEAEKHADNFYNAMKLNDYETMKNMIDESMLEVNSIEEISVLFVQKESLGEMISFTKETGFDYREANGLTVVRFLYTVEYKAATLYEYIRLTKRGDAYKVVNYGYYDNKEKRQEFIDHVEG